MTASTQETEVALLVVSTDPAGTADRVAALRGLAGHRLEPLPDRGIHDTYYDFADRRLARAGHSLRWRRVDGEDRVTLKGRSADLPGGGKRRPELEAPWSPGMARSLWRTLEARGLLDAGAEPPDAALPPGRALESRGLRPIQARRTRRRPRAVRREVGGDVVAELVVDAVDYELGEARPRIHEVEVEAAADAGEAVLDALCGALLDALPGELRRWSHSKLSTGLALARLRSAGGLGPAFRGAVPTATLDALERRLGRRG